jgi:hypothetical protein
VACPRRSQVAQGRRRSFGEQVTIACAALSTCAFLWREAHREDRVLRFQLAIPTSVTVQLPYRHAVEFARSRLARTI